MVAEMTNKVALITGGATGIGRAVACGLAGKGISVVINYSRSEQDALETVKAVREYNVDCLLHKADVSNDLQVREMIAKVVAKFGRLDYVVNNAGATNFVDLTDLEGLKEEFWDRAMAVNVKGTFFVSRAASTHLKETRGSIVNITSIAGMTGRGSSMAYCASKAAAISVTKSLAQALAPEVRVNAVAPGIVMTRWVEGKEDHVERLGAGTPLGRVCSPEDVAEVVINLLLAAGMMTGQNVVVDGGATI